MNGKKFIIFGAGRNGVCLKGVMEREDIFCFVDNDNKKAGKKIDGIPIISFEELLKIQYYEKDIIVSPNNYLQIKNELEERGIRYILLKDFLKEKNLKIKDFWELSEEYIEALNMINTSANIVDLGCGTHPLPKAKVAVDKFIEPCHRIYGENKEINIASIEQNDCCFVQADLENLPFKDKEFELAYSHHVIEHLNRPEKALKEMQRIARKGVIMCPSVFAEGMFGREYHKWEISFPKIL